MEKSFWDDRYAEDGFAYGTEPNEYLLTLAEQFKPGQRVLVVGDGEGRNGVWLAKQGLDVVAVDQSKVGLDKAQQLATDAGVKLETIQADLFQWEWPQGEFDLVVIIYVHFPPSERKRLHQAAINALKSGGELIMESFSTEQLNYSSGGPPVLEMLYTEQMLLEDFAGNEVIEQTSGVMRLNEGKYHVGDGAVIRLRLQRT